MLTGPFAVKVSIIIPAFNEAAYLPAALHSIRAAADHLRAKCEAGYAVSVDVIVVDNHSTDETAAVARIEGSTVVHEPVQGIARARNTGARHAPGDVLVFIDADVSVPPTLLHEIHETMREPSCIGGGVDVNYRPRRLAVRLYLRAWRIFGHLTGMVQGATQFCRKRVFEQVGGYDETAWIGEDIDFYPEPPTAGTGGALHGPVHKGATRATLVPAFRQVAPVACADLDEPTLHTGVPALESRLDGQTGPVQ